MDIKPIFKADISDPDYRALCRLKYEILVTEQQKTIAGCDHEQKLVVDTLDNNALIYVAVRNGEVIGSIRLNFPGDHTSDMEALSHHYRLDLLASPEILPQTFTVTRFLVALPYRNSRVAYQLIATATGYVHKKLNKSISIVGSTPAIFPFHLRLGYRRYTTEPVLFEEGMLVYPMLLFLNDRQQLQSVRSPLLSFLEAPLPASEKIANIVDQLILQAPQQII